MEIKTGIRQGCVLSSVLFSIAIDWVPRRIVKDQRRGIRWTYFSALEDLDFVDDVASTLAHSTAHPRKDRPTQHAQCPGWPDNNL